MSHMIVAVNLREMSEHFPLAASGPKVVVVSRRDDWGHDGTIF